MSLYAFYEQYFPFWKALKEEDKNYLCENTAEEHFDREQPVHDNMGCSGLFIVRSGRLRLYMLSENGKEITLYRLVPGDICMLSASCVLNSITRDEKSRTFSSNSKRSYILRTSSRSRRLILSSIVSFAVWLKCTRTI